MRNYKRLTINLANGKIGCLQEYTQTDLINRLADLEDKIENGTLVELPTTDKDILEDYAHKIFDSWNDITGAVNKNCSWYYEALWVIDDIVGMVWGITSRQYEAKLRELKEKENE